MVQLGVEAPEKSRKPYRQPFFAFELESTETTCKTCWTG